MQKDEEVESLIKKISDEIETVKNHVSEAKYYLKVDNYNDALHHLKEAKETSTCSYCQNRLQEAIYSIEYNKNICNINSKQCSPNKEDILRNIEEFYLKLPNIEDIRHQKAIAKSLNEPFDPIGNITKSFDDMGKSLGTLWSNMFKF